MIRRRLLLRSWPSLVHHWYPFCRTVRSLRCPEICTQVSWPIHELHPVKKMFMLLASIVWIVKSTFKTFLSLYTNSFCYDFRHCFMLFSKSFWNLFRKRGLFGVFLGLKFLSVFFLLLSCPYTAFHSHNTESYLIQGSHHFEWWMLNSWKVILSLNLFGGNYLKHISFRIWYTHQNYLAS